MHIQLIIYHFCLANTIQDLYEDVAFVNLLGVKHDIFSKWLIDNPDTNMLVPVDLMNAYLMYCDEILHDATIGLTDDYFARISQILGEDNSYGLSIQYAAMNGINDRLSSLAPGPFPLPEFNHPRNQPSNTWIVEKFPTEDPFALTPITRILHIDSTQSSHRRSLCNIVHDHLKQNEGDVNYRYFYHGCIEKNASSICFNTIELSMSNPLGNDFGPGFYVGNNIREALDWADYRARITNDRLIRPAVIIFRCDATNYDKFQVEELVVNKEDTSNPLKWHNFVERCRHRRTRGP